MGKKVIGCATCAAILVGAVACSSRDQSRSSVTSTPASQSRPASLPATSTAASQTRPASLPASTPSVQGIRSLILDAIAMRDDPKQARAMMIRAAELTAQLPPGSDLKALMVEYAPDEGQLDHLIRPTATKIIEEKKNLSVHIALCQKYLSSTYPFLGMAHNGEGFIFPQPMTDKVLKEQRLLRDGNVFYSVVSSARPETRWKTYFVSPDETKVVLQDWLHGKPTGVLRVDTGRIVTVDAPEIDGHYNVYPFTFREWSKDSNSFVVEVNGTYVKGPGQFLAYRELWRVQADTGKAKRIKRQEQPWQESLKWED